MHAVTDAADAIAVTGLAGRFPGACTMSQFWRNTIAGRDCVTRRTDASGTLLWSRAELACDAAKFDPAFFGMSAREALVLDPQHRVLLECAWEALADASVAGHDPITRTAIFAGANYSGYRELLARSDSGVTALEFDSGTDKDFLATRIAYRLGLRGPCVTVQTACSSSLVAVHLACQALLEYEADQALAGGVSLVLPHVPGWRYEPRGIHSADGICRPFDADAKGTVMGDGAGLVVLRRLADALADGARIYAVLLGSSVNNDGARKIGYAAPSAAGQTEVIRTAHARADVAPAEIGYVEAHGTGTPLGDRVELRALTDAFAGSGRDGQWCAMGSAKGGIGHLDVAAGVVGLIRCVLALHEAVLPGTVNHRRPHPELGIERTPFHVPTAATPWRTRGRRVAAVSSFGVGGTNAHVVLAEHRGTVPAGPRRTLDTEGYRARRYWPTYAEPAAPADDTVRLYRMAWAEHPADVLADDTDRLDYDRVLLFADIDDTSDLLAELLRDRRPNLVRAAPPGLLPDSAKDRADLFGERPPGTGRQLVLCAWPLAREPRRGYDLMTALAADPLAVEATDLVLLTRGVCRVLGDECGDPAVAALTGLARVLSMELPTFRARVLDLPSVEAGPLAEAVRAALTWSAEPLLALRGRRWWRQTAVPIEPGKPARRSGGLSAVLGVGQIGAATARTLARADTAIALVARPGSGADRAERLAAELRASGAAVHLDTCDLGDPDQVTALLARLAERFGRLDQMVLAAGISGEDAYQPSSRLPAWADEPHFRVKIGGLAAIVAAGARHGVGRVVAMSSLAGVLGAISLGPYAAAASAMDARAGEGDGGTPGLLSIGWDAWQRADPAAEAHERRMVRDGLSQDEADTALAQLLASDMTGHVLVVKGDLAARWDRYVREPLRHAKVSSAAAPAPDATLADRVLDAWRAALGDHDLGPDDDLVSRGADSLTSIGVLNDLGTRLGTPLPTDLAFELTTVAALADRIAGLLTTARPVSGETVRSWQDTGPDIWCLHPISGNPEPFRPLADLLTGMRVRAVVGRPLPEVVEETIEAQAERYHALLHDADPPRVVVGWSYGGILALALAHLIHRHTGALPAVVVLDIPAPTARGPRDIADVGDAEILAAVAMNRARELGRPMTLSVPRVRDPDDRAAVAYTLDRLRADQVLTAGGTEELARRLAEGYRRRMSAIERYRPAPYPGRVVLLRAAEPEFGGTGLMTGVLPAPIGEPSWGWAALAGGGCDVRVLDGHHATLLLPPSVHTVAQVVRTLAGG